MEWAGWPRGAAIPSLAHVSADLVARATLLVPTAIGPKRTPYLLFRVPQRPVPPRQSRGGTRSGRGGGSGSRCSCGGCNPQGLIVQEIDRGPNPSHTSVLQEEFPIGLDFANRDIQMTDDAGRVGALDHDIPTDHPKYPSIGSTKG